MSLWLLVAAGGLVVYWATGRAGQGALRRSSPRFPPRELVARGAGDERIVLGKVGRTRVVAEQRGSLAVVGPTQSGKTTQLAIPALRAWSGPAIASSVKSDLMVASLDARRSVGNVIVIDPARTSGLATHRYCPVAASRSEQGARRSAHLVATAANGVEHASEARFWQALAEKLLAPLLRAANCVDGSMATCSRWLDTGDLDEPLRVLEVHGEHGLAQSLEATKWRDPRQLGSVIATAETYLAPYAQEDVALEPFDVAGFFDGPATLYLVAPARDQQRFAPLLATCTAEVLDHAMERAHREGGCLASPLLVVLDEAAQLGPARDLDVLAATGAGQGIVLVSVFQDLAQLRTRFGTRAETVLNNHRTKVLFGGVGDPATLELFSALGGEKLETVRTMSRSGRDHSTALAEQWRPRFSAGDLRALPFGAAFVVAGRHPAGVVMTDIGRARARGSSGAPALLATLRRWRSTTQVMRGGPPTRGRSSQRSEKTTPSTSTTLGPTS